MCTVIEKRLKGHPKTAKEDIPVYKHCNTFDLGCKSHNQQFVYFKDKLYKTEFSYDSSGCHSDDKEGEYVNSLIYQRIDRIYVAEGFHSYREKERTKAWMKQWPGNVCLFIVPKGAKYYENGCGNIVSNQIIFKEVVK